MIYIFKAYGHPNITAKHKTTLEFTKEKDLTLKGDCIIGVNSDFSLNELKRFNNKIKIIIKTNGLEEEINAEVNPGFDDGKEIVIRKSDFRDKRTFAVKADKAASDLKRGLVERTKKQKQEIFVSLL